MTKRDVPFFFFYFFEFHTCVCWMTARWEYDMFFNHIGSESAAKRKPAAWRPQLIAGSKTDQNMKKTCFSVFRWVKEESTVTR